MGIGTSRFQRNAFISTLGLGLGSAILLFLKQRKRQKYQLEDYTVTHSTGKITEYYDFDSRGGSLFKAHCKSTQDIRVVKSISKIQIKSIARLEQEIAIMKMLDHPNIIKLFETFDDGTKIYLVMERCTGGELFDRLVDAGHFTEVQAAITMQHIFRVVFYMHEHYVCHRDLKPENFLFAEKVPIEKTSLKLIDFGLSCKFRHDQSLTTTAGTPYYVAPQVLQGKYDQRCDLWSCGVLMYVLLCGYPPFFGETDVEVLAKVRLGNYSFNATNWKNVSENAKNLIRKLLKMNPRDRPTAEQALSDAWIWDKLPSDRTPIP